MIGDRMSRPRRDRLIQVRVSDDEYRTWRLAALERDVSLAQLVRRQMRQLIEGAEGPIRWWGTA